MKEGKEDKFNFFIPVDFEKAKSKKGEEVMRVKGVASTDEKDSEGEELLPIGFELDRFLNFGNINWNHQGKNDPSKIIGEPDVAKITPKGELYIEGTLYKGHPLAQAVWAYADTLQKNGSTRKLGWSIEGRALSRDPQNSKRITKALITGVAITPTPVNCSTYMDLVKGEQKGDFIDYKYDSDVLEKSESESKYLYEFSNNGRKFGITKSFDVEEIDKCMDIAATKPLVPESLDKRPKVLEPEMKKAVEYAERQYKAKKADVIKKAFLGGILSTEEFNKAISNFSKLVPKKVQVKGKDGKISHAIRWVNPETEMSEFSGNKGREFKDQSEIESKIEDVLDNSKTMSGKIRDLINLGVYDNKVLCVLTGGKIGDINYYLKESEIDPSKLPDISEKVKDKIREEQKTSDTPEGRESSTLLREIPLEEIWENYSDNLESVIEGDHKFAIAYGTGGVGKTYSFNQLAKKLELREFNEEIQPTKDQYDFVRIGGKITPGQVYAEMYRHRDKLLLFDDCDSFLKLDEVQGFLKAGLDTGEHTQISNKSGAVMYNIQGDKESGKIPNTFSFTGRVIAITNLTTKEIDQAVRSRALCSNLTMTVDETMGKLDKIKDKITIYSADKTREIEVPAKFRDLAFEVLKKNKERIGSGINTRMYSSAALQAMKGGEKGYDDERLGRIVLASYLNSLEEDSFSRSKK